MGWGVIGKGATGVEGYSAQLAAGCSGSVTA
jgi:hypothetical protein